MSEALPPGQKDTRERHGELRALSALAVKHFTNHIKLTTYYSHLKPKPYPYFEIPVIRIEHSVFIKPAQSMIIPPVD